MKSKKKGSNSCLSIQWAQDTKEWLRELIFGFSDKEVAKIFARHKIEQQNRLFWVVQVISLLNILNQTYALFILKNSSIIMFLIGLTNIFWLSLVWGLCVFRF